MRRTFSLIVSSDTLPDLTAGSSLSRLRNFPTAFQDRVRHWRRRRRHKSTSQSDITTPCQIPNLFSRSHYSCGVLSEVLAVGEIVGIHDRADVGFFDRASKIGR